MLPNRTVMKKVDRMILTYAPLDSFVVQNPAVAGCRQYFAVSGYRPLQLLQQAPLTLGPSQTATCRIRMAPKGIFQKHTLENAVFQPVSAASRVQRTSQPRRD